jgi:hypothetical protein
MRNLLGSLLGVIAVGVVLIAYGLLGPRAGATAVDPYQSARVVPASSRVALTGDTDVTGLAAVQPATSGLHVRCEPGQRAVIRNIGGATAAECVGGVTSESRYATTPAALAYQVSDVREVRPVRAYTAAPPRPVRAAAVERRAGRDWKKTAMVIGGSSAAGAGVGAIFGGKKGALIGAAIGGGAGTIYEVKKR